MNTDDYKGHTPGPWCWDEPKTRLRQLVEKPSDGRTLRGDERGMVVLWPTRPRPWDNKAGLGIGVCDGDKELIAAAPDLLAFYLRVKEIMDMEEIEEIVRVELIWTVMQEMIE